MKIILRILDMLIKFWIFLVLVTMCQKMDAQRWQDVNRGLYPNSIQGTLNARNESLGMRYSHLFEKPVSGLPLGVYASISNTIPEGWRLPYYDEYNTYSWERKYSLGGIITLPYSRQMHGTRTMLTVAAIYNSHEDVYMDDWPGRFDPNVAYTNNWGVDLGVQVQTGRFTAHISIDALNFFRYAEIGAGYCFYRLRK